ncbi:SDR family oxidoreductase [Candidatus Woesearchaeota archaeon]|nr:SDR family oxidoreductase [Candidatus Woesearchaeota archaeon]
MNILVTGGSGVVGSFLAKHLAADNKVTAAHLTAPAGSNSIQLDLTNHEKTLEAVNKINPDVIVHAAGIKDVKLCEQNPELARQKNVVTTANLAEAASQNNSFLIYVSSDYVFEGSEGMYREDSPANPWTAYGRTKLQGEQAVKKLCRRYAVCRTSGIYCSHPDNIFTFIYDKLKNNEADSYFTDVYNSATNLSNFADMISRVIELNKTDAYHLAGSERISRCEFAVKIADTFKRSRALVRPVELGEEKRRQQFRPRDLSLDISRSQKKLGIEFFSVSKGLEQIKNEANIS